MHRLGLLALLLGVGALLPGASAPATAVCHSVGGYEGPCPLGALPAFFDDFQYTSGSTTGDVSALPVGDIFGENVWMTERGPEMTRGWYRSNRNDLRLPGSITFHDGVMRMLVPAGTSREDFIRSVILHTGATFHTGTYHFRVRLSPLWKGQELRQTSWTMSPEQFVFEEIVGAERRRYTYWAELDFENQNHFQGSRETGELIPDFVEMMSVGNHYGAMHRHPGGPRTLSTEGPVEFMTGRGALARDGFARHPRNQPAPLVPDWSERWLDLLIHVDPETRESIYRMQPVADDPQLREVGARAVRIDERFFPQWPMHFAFSLHWVRPTGSLQNDFWMEVDWVYHSPITGLSVREIEGQVTHHRSAGRTRLNTTGGPTFRDHGVPLEAAIEGPASLSCGVDGNWDLIVNRAGEVHTTMRVRTINAEGIPSRWHEVVQPSISLRPASEIRRIEIDATVTDRWRHNGVQIDPITGWQYPAEGNETATARKSVTVTCGR